MQKFLSSVFVLSMSVGLQILIMVYGWGLQPRSWWWIIGGGVVGVTALRSLWDTIDAEGKKKKV